MQTFMHYRAVFFFVLIACGAIISACAERDRVNIFDPDSGIDTLDMSVYITSADTVTTLSWFPPRTLKYEGFNLYRKSAAEPSFRRIATLSSNQGEYKDRDTEFDVEYTYYLTIQGENSESPPTRSLQVTPGPASHWVLDRFGLNIFKLTYDLRHKQVTKYAVWIPENLALNPGDQVAVVTYPQYRFVEIFQTRTGSSLTGLSQFRHPYDCLYFPAQNKFWLTDSSGYLYRVQSPDGAIELLDQSLNQPSQITRSNQAVYVLDRGNKQILAYNSGGNKIQTIKDIGSIQLQNPLFIEATPASGQLYIIDQTQSKNVLYAYNPSLNSAQKIYEADHLNTVKIDPEDQAIWVSVDVQQNSRIMQLSLTGDRLSEIEGFGSIADFKINPLTKTFIVADYRNGLVKHIRSNSTTIGIFREAIYPTRVYIQ